MRRINPENCDYLRLGSQTVFMQWAFIDESVNFNASLQDQPEFELNIESDQILNKGVKPMHFIDYFFFENNDNHTAYTKAVENNVTILAEGMLDVHWEWKELPSKDQSYELVYGSCGITDLGAEFKDGDKLLNRLQMEEVMHGKETYETQYSQAEIYDKLNISILLFACYDYSNA